MWPFLLLTYFGNASLCVACKGEGSARSRIASLRA